MKKSGYKDTYYRLVTKANLEQIKHILNEHEYYDKNTVEKIEYEGKDNLPYFILAVDSAEYIGRRGAYAVLDGIFIEINSIIPYWEGIFYLSILIIRKTTHEKLKLIINPEMLKEHELHHLRQKIEHIDQYPGYIEESRKYNAGSCTYANIERSIQFEVNKIFFSELPAFISDYERGERHYHLYSDGLALMATSHDKNEFVQYNLAQYIAKLEFVYSNRFSDKKAKITEYIAKEVNKQGKKRFGENTMIKLGFVLLKVISLVQNNGKYFEIDEDYI